MTNAQLVKRMSDGYTNAEIAKEFYLPETTIAKKLRDLIKMTACKNSKHLVASYLRKKIIE